MGVNFPLISGGAWGSCPSSFAFLGGAGAWFGFPLRGAGLAPFVFRCPGCPVAGRVAHAPRFSLSWVELGPCLASRCGARGSRPSFFVFLGGARVWVGVPLRGARLVPLVFRCPGWGWGLVWRPIAGRRARAPCFSLFRGGTRAWLGVPLQGVGLAPLVFVLLSGAGSWFGVLLQGARLVPLVFRCPGWGWDLTWRCGRAGLTPFVFLSPGCIHSIQAPTEIHARLPCLFFCVHLSLQTLCFAECGSVCISVRIRL